MTGTQMGVVYEAMPARGCAAVRLYLTAQKEAGVLWDLFLGDTSKTGCVLVWNYQTHLRVGAEVIGEEIKRIARQHRLTLKFQIRVLDPSGHTRWLKLNTATVSTVVFFQVSLRPWASFPRNDVGELEKVRRRLRYKEEK